mmetsp:Transcript_81342/g.256506  ORF Transcript_81342/g.256506 Transcript_81342/m.256506 type:complete len:264 (-) Transcript_81342:1347-2138(-)
MASCSATVSCATCLCAELFALLLSQAPGPLMPRVFAASLSSSSSCAQLFSQTPVRPWPFLSCPPNAASQAAAPLIPSFSADRRSSSVSCAQRRSHAAPGTQAAPSQASALPSSRVVAAARSSSESCAQLLSQTPPACLRRTSQAPLASQLPCARPRDTAAARWGVERSAQDLFQVLVGGAGSWMAALEAEGHQEASSKPSARAAICCCSESSAQARPKTGASRRSQAAAPAAPSSRAASASEELSADHAFSLAGRTASSTSSA